MLKKKFFLIKKKCGVEKLILLKSKENLIEFSYNLFKIEFYLFYVISNDLCVLRDFPFLSLFLKPEIIFSIFQMLATIDRLIVLNVNC